MSIFQLAKVSKYYSNVSVLDEVDLDINQGDRVGVIGLNGSGKTTLLKLISGEIEPLRGRITKSGNLRVSFVAQTQDTGLEGTVLDLCLSQHPELGPLRDQIAQCEIRMAEPSFNHSADMKKVIDKYSIALGQFEDMGGYKLESTLSKNLQRVLLKNVSSDRILNQLSAGELKIAQIASALSTNPNVLLIDEPTNHADTITSEAIDNLIINFKGTLVYVTHDRYLLNKSAGRIVEVRNGKLHEFKGTYDDYVEFRQQSYGADLRMYKSQQKAKTILRESMLRLKSKGAAGFSKPARTAKAIEKRLDRMDLLRPKQVTDTLKLSLGDIDKGGYLVLRAVELSKTFESHQIFSNVNLEINRGDRVGVVGNSGSGKTTLLNCLLGYQQPTSGEVWMGPSIKVGYLSQADLTIDYNSIIHDELKKSGCVDTNQAYGLLKNWLFRENDLERKIGELSGGEKKKVQLMKIMLERPNFLVLDEPTDHLDMASREGLENAVRDYECTLFVVSHDRYFLDKVTDQTLILTNNTDIMLNGNYSSNLSAIDKYLRPK